MHPLEVERLTRRQLIEKVDDFEERNAMLESRVDEAIDQLRGMEMLANRLRDGL